MATPLPIPFLIETIASSSVRCNYCEDSSHLTIECPGLRRDNPIAKAYREKHFEAKMATPTCSRCNEPQHAGRPLFPTDCWSLHQLMCGDCLSGGTPLSAQPAREPEPLNYHAWQTPAYDGVGGL